MTKLFILLTGYLLFGQPTYSVAQKNVQLGRDVLPGTDIQQRREVLPGRDVLLGHDVLLGRDIETQNAQLEQCCEKIMKVGPCLAFTGDHKGKVRLRLLGIYSHGPTLFFALRLKNRSTLDYAIDSVRFWITEPGWISERGRKEQVLRPLLPVFIYNSTATVPHHERFTTIYAIRRFTLPPGRRLLIVIKERAYPTGGRDLRIQGGNMLLRWTRLI